MKAERWKQIKTHYQRAIETAPENRRKLLSETCGGDPELLREVESMLEFESESENIFEEIVSDAAENLLAENEALPIGERIDNYRLVKEIGRGGMGVVYQAERVDGLFDRRAALKIIKRGMDTDAILKRFATERRILASLDHPNIARLLDGGTTRDGLPYFVLEYVEGRPLLEFCDERNLNLSERLKLFRRICEAVTYAHQNLVVHRDLKPSNIIINEKGEPKLLDFGIAKLLHSESTGETQLTETGQRLLTPEYASPEQIKGERLTTQSDVYSLGVLFAKLLEVESRESRVEGQEPKSKIQKPRSKTVNPELEAILQTALHTETGRRYSSVEQFSEDIRRYLEGLPVLARKDSFVYRTAKFIGRHRTTVMVTLLVALALLTATVFSIMQASRANAAQLRAEQRFNDVRKLANNVLFEYHDAIEQLPNSTEVRAKMLKDSLEYLDSLSKEAADDRELLRELGNAYEKVGTIQGNTWVANFNDSSAMLVSYQKSFEIRERLARLEPDNDEIQRELAISYENLADSHHQIGELQKTLELYKKALSIIDVLAAKDAKHLTYLARLYNRVAHTQGFPGEINLGETAAATENYRKSVEIMQKLYDKNPTDAKYRWGTAVYTRNYGNILMHGGNPQAALGQLTASVQIAELWVQDDPYNATAIETLGISCGKISDVFAELGELPKAIEFQKKAIAIDEPAFLSDPKNGRARDIYALYEKLAGLYTKQQKFAEAEKLYQKALKIIEETVAENPSNVEQQVSLADTQYAYSVMLIEKGALIPAKALLEKALKIFEATDRDKKNPRLRTSEALIYVSFGNINSKNGELAEALNNYEKARTILQEQTRHDPANAFLKRHLQNLETKISNVPNR